MGQKILLLVAMEQELAVAPRSDMILVHTGVGKVNAAWRSALAIHEHRPDLVINFGTAGTLRADLSGLVEVGTAVQRDMDVRGLGLLLGHTPLEADSHELTFSPAPLICGTGDSFVESPPEMPCDVVDMELYGIAKICRAESIPLRAFKFVSDNADSSASLDWRAALREAAQAFEARVKNGLYLF